MSEWGTSNTLNEIKPQSTLPNYYNKTITALLQNRQTKKTELIYNFDKKDSRFKVTRLSNDVNKKDTIDPSYLIHLSEIIEKDQGSRQTLVVFNQNRLKQEVDSNLGIFKTNFYNNFDNRMIQSKPRKQISEFIPGNQVAYEYIKPITFENNTSHSNETNKEEDKSQSSNQTVRSFISEAKIKLEQSKSQVDLNLRSSGSNLDLSSYDNEKSFSEILNSEIKPIEIKELLKSNSNESINGKISKKKILTKKKRKKTSTAEYSLIAKKHENASYYDTNDSTDIISSDSISKTNDSKTIVKPVNTNDSVNHLYDSLEFKPEIDHAVLVNETEPENIIIKPFESTSSDSLEMKPKINKSIMVINTEDKLTIELENEKDSLESADDDKREKKFTRQDSLLLNKILLLNPREPSKREEQMFHSE